MRTKVAAGFTILLAALLGLAAPARAVPLERVGWPQEMGGADTDLGSAVATDAAGNVYVVGSFRGVADFGPFQLTAAGGEDVFVGKVDAGGSWKWAVRAGGRGDDAALGVALDGDGSVYVSGSYQNAVFVATPAPGAWEAAGAVFGNVALPAGTPQLPPLAGGRDAFVAKLDSNGGWQWAAAAGEKGDAWASGVAVNEEHEVWVAGKFSRTIAFPRAAGAAIELKTWSENPPAPYPQDATSPDTDAFVAKLSPGGEWQWALQGGGAFNRPGDSLPANWCCSSSNAVYQIDFFYNYCSYTSFSYSHNESVCQPAWRPSGTDYAGGGFGFSEAQCISYFGQAAAPANNFDFLWWMGGCGPDYYSPALPTTATGGTRDAAANRLYGRPETTYGTRYSADAAVGIAVKRIPIGPTNFTPKNIIYVTGSFEQDFQAYHFTGAGARVAFLAAPLTAAGAQRRDLFVGKIVEEGKPLVDNLGFVPPDPNPVWTWVRDAGQPASADEIWANGFTMDGDGNLFVAGGYRGRPQLGATRLPDTSGRKGAFAARIVDQGAGGSWAWAREARASGDAEAVSVAVDGQSVDRRGVAVAGSFSGTLTQPSAPAAYQSLAALAGTDVFVTRYGAGDGAVAWTARGGLYQDDAVDVQNGLVRGGIASDVTGTVFVTGSFDRVTSLIEGRTMSFPGGKSVFAPLSQLPASHPTDYSVSLWFKTTAAAQGLFEVVHRNDDGSIPAYDRELWLDADGNLNARLWRTTGVEIIQTAGGSLADGQWHHVVHTYGGAVGGQRLYVDGMERTSGLLSSSDFTAAVPAGAGANGFLLGYTKYSNTSFTGKLSNVTLGAAVLPEGVWALYQDPAGQPADSTGKLLFSAGGGRDAFLASVGSDGAWRESQAWVVGQQVPTPVGAVDEQPTFLSPANWQDYFYWSRSEKKLYALWEVGAVIKWQTQPLSYEDKTIVTVGAASWPENPQTHVAGVPVNVQKFTGEYKYVGIQTPMSVRSGDLRASADANDATSNAQGKLFQATRPGYTVLLYTQGGENPEYFPVSFEVVRTHLWDDPAVLQDGAACNIGQRITDGAHTDPDGKNGYVFFPDAFYDGVGLDAAYSRETRTGPILPVNRRAKFNVDTSATAAAAGRDMVVVWYRTNEKSIPWPVRPVRYNCQWPSAAPKIVIASELGSDVYNQPVLDPNVFPQARIYRQENQALAGYNPNEEHAAFFPSATGSGYDALFALRNDLYDPAQGVPSLPYVLLKYRNPADGEWSMLAYHVLMTDAKYTGFQYHGTAGTAVFPPYPVRILPGCSSTSASGLPFWMDQVNSQAWARSAGSMTVRYLYPIQPGFDYAPNPYYPTTFESTPGQCVKWLDRRPSTDGASIPVGYTIAWPTDVPVLQVGETLLAAKRGLPDIVNQAATQVVYDDLADSLYGGDYTRGLVQLVDPLSARVVDFCQKATCTTAEKELPSSIATFNRNGRLYFTDLPFHLQQRLSFDPRNKQLAFQGYFDASGMGDPLQLLNVMTGSERTELYKLSGLASPPADNPWRKAVDALFYLTRNPQRIDKHDPSKSITVRIFGKAVALDKVEAGAQPLIGVQDLYTIDGLGHRSGTRTAPVPDGTPEPLEALGVGFALTAGAALGEGYVTLAFNNDPSLGPLPVSLKVIRVDCGPYLGEVKVIQSDNVFDEKLTLRHSGDFGANPENFTFEWYFHPDESGASPTPPPSPETGQLHGWILYKMAAGANDITLGGANLVTLSDNWFYVRYKGYPTCGNATTPTPWAGAPGSTALNPKAQLAEGWVKRVVRSLNAYEARVKDFHAAPTATYASMILQAGERYEGDVAMNNNPGNLNAMGLIAAYETVLRRGMSLSIDGTPPIDYGPGNNALLLAASRIADFYTLLGNEAVADAADPTIGFGTAGGDYGTKASSMFAFENQLDSLLEEELALLRGRDAATGRPVYNRLVWNFTSGEGEVAYANVYGVSDQNGDGVIDEYDARILYPQGHGDAWGHYLTALTTYYKLLRHPYYSWDPRAEAVLVAGAPVMVDYLDERKFARVASAKAKAGAEIVDLAYRLDYVDDPAGQWQGYKDTDDARAWGLAEWGRRAGQGAYFDWVTANAILPAKDDDPSHVERIQKIDRSTVLDLAEIRAAYTGVQAKLDAADAGLSPLGLAKGVVPFDINPAILDPAQGSYARSHFEQIYDRAETALANAVDVFNYASESSQSLRRNQDTLGDFAAAVTDQERDYTSRLIELYGYPYGGDIGPAGTYASGYDGPDLYHYMWVDPTELTGETAPKLAGYDLATVTLNVRNDFSGGDYTTGQPVWQPWQENTQSESFPYPNNGVLTYTVSADGGVVKPDNMGVRRAQGELQRNLGDIYRARASVQSALTAYDNLIESIASKKGAIEQADMASFENLRISYNKYTSNQVFSGVIVGLKAVVGILKVISNATKDTMTGLSECPPKSVGFSNDVTSVPRCVLQVTSVAVKTPIEATAEGLSAAADVLGGIKDMVAAAFDVDLAKYAAAYAVSGQFGDLSALLREEPLRRLDVFQALDQQRQANEAFAATLAQGERLLEERAAYRARTAAKVQSYRYQDMTFRVFRNDAIQKYRAQFDLAARYAYLAATAYDYETNLIYDAGNAGTRFLSDIVRQRALGQVVDGHPIAGSPGLADPLARLRANFEVLKPRLGFNNPQIETNRFSLRTELLRLNLTDPYYTDLDGATDPLANLTGNTAATAWYEALTDPSCSSEGQPNRPCLVPDLWQVPEFKRFCRPFAPASAGSQPGIVIPFSSSVVSRHNFFGWPLGGGDSTYDPSNFSTRIRSVGIWFTGYENAGLATTPRAYLVPAGLDILRSPTSGDFQLRQWRVVDQVLPEPFPILTADLQDPGWIPVDDSLAEMLGGVRRFSSFRVYPDPGDLNLDEMVPDTRLVGRSVWNSRWLLIIPGASLHYDPVVGLSRFVENVSDIKLIFETYGYSGN